MVNILICDPNFAPVASPTRTPLLIKLKAWQKKGIKVTVICSSEAKIFYQKNIKGVEYITFPFVWKSKIRLTAPLEYIRANLLVFPLLFKVKGRFTIIYSFSSTLDIIFFPFMLRLLDRKIHWFSIVDNIVLEPGKRPGNYFLNTIPYVAFLLCNILLKKTDGIFVVTNLLKIYYQKKGITVVKTGTGNGLDIDSFKGRIPIHTPKFTALFAARLNPSKGIYDLIEITKIVVKENKKYTLGMVGVGDEKTKKNLRDLIKKNNLSQNIFLLGFKNTKERWDLYRNSKFFLFPSYAEGCPQVVLEAFAANKLVIAYDLPEYRDVFKTYIKSGELLIADKGNTSQMANIIINIEKNIPKFHNNLKDYSWDKIVHNEFSTFMKVLE
ncbi:glycosyltransferase family 4 protein [soil metagenome]